MARKWKMPNWMLPYRPLINNTGGNPIESLMNDKHTDGFNNAIRSTLIISVESQINLLTMLHDRGMLRGCECLSHHSLTEDLRSVHIKHIGFWSKSKFLYCKECRKVNPGSWKYVK